MNDPVYVTVEVPPVNYKASEFPTRRLATVPRHSVAPGGHHRAVVVPSWWRIQTMGIAMWWFAIGGITNE